MGANPYSPESNPPRAFNGSRRPPSFASLFDINRQTIALLMDVAATPQSNQTWSRWRLLGNELLQLNTDQHESLARCPFSLIDPGLRDAPASSCHGVPDEPIQRELTLSPMLPQDRLDHLAHAALLFAWHLVRSDVIAPRLVFGMNTASTSFIAQATLTDIHRLAQEQVRHGRVSPRWHNRPDMWLQVIRRARSPHRDDFATVSTRGLQLFLQELIADQRGR